MKRKTKIVATISDLRCDVDFIRQLFEAGMDVARLNTAHQTEEDTLKIVNNVREVSDKIALLLDTKGPEIRTLHVDGPFAVDTGEEVLVYRGAPPSGAKGLSTTYIDFIDDVPDNAQILIDDGDIMLEVQKKTRDFLRCTAQNAGTIKNKKSINVPNASFALPSLSEKDKKYVEFAIKHDIDFIAHSFVRNKYDVLAIQEILDKNNSDVKIIAKIENQEGVSNIQEIMDHAYGIMVARGDLAIEIPYEKIPGIQKKLITAAISRRKPVIIATQMLHSMINNPRPTRAEVSDIANAIYSKTDAIMLSGESAFGKYPVEAVITMSKVAKETEKTRSDFHDAPVCILSSEISAYLAKSAVHASLKLNAKAIIADTTTGRTIRNLSGYRGKRPVYAQCYSKRTVRELALSFGVFPYYIQPSEEHEFISKALERLRKKGKLKSEDRIVILGGNFGRNHGASFIDISTVDNLIK
ncbi:MAG: pyruvate kinase [Bacteroidota bacterium]